MKKIENIDSLKLANTIPNDNDLHNMVAKLVVETADLTRKIEQKDKEIERLNNIIKNLDKMFEYYFLGNLKYDQDTVKTIYIKYVQLKELKEGK